MSNYDWGCPKKYTSPAKLARALSGNTSVNAWIILYIKRPRDIKWQNHGA